MFASKEVRRRSQLHSHGRFTLTARKLAEFLASAENEEEHLVQQLRDSEGKSIRQNELLATPDAVAGEGLSQALRAETATQITKADQPEATALYGDF